MDEYVDCPYCKSESLAEEFRSGGGHCPVCGRANYELDGYMDGYRNAHRHHAPERSKMSTMRTAAINFVATQNTTDREELMFRAHRHASDRTGQLPVPTAQRVVQAFVAAVNREITAGGAPEGERKKSHRTAAVVADFPDELMF